MDEIISSNKENVIGISNCSPIGENCNEKLFKEVSRSIDSPAVLRESGQANCLSSPGIEISPSLSGKSVINKAHLISTPIHPSNREVRPPSILWEDIRKLDEEEVWVERTQVVTQQDHSVYCEIAKEIVNNIIENIPFHKFAMENGSSEPPDTELDENLCDGDTAVVTEEKKEDALSDAKTVSLDAGRLPSQTSEKSILEDNDFIYSCSSLNDTVKEILEDEEPISPKKFADIPDDVDEPICNEDDDESKIPTTQISGGDHIDDMNFDEAEFKPGGVFQLELDYLESLGSTSEDNEHMSDLARQSLYVKFDPLVAASSDKRKETQVPNTNLSKMNPSDMLYSGPMTIPGSDLLVMDTPPMKLVQRRTAPRAAAAKKEQTPGNEAVPVTPVDRLLELSPKLNDTDMIDQPAPAIEDTPKYNGNENNDDATLVQPLLYSKSDLDDAVSAERNKLLAQWKEENALSELEMKERTVTIEKLKEEKAKALAEINEMKVVMSEYEQTMAQMIEDREKDKSNHAKSNSEILQERDQLQQDLHNTEKSFAHLHARFEKLKTVVTGYKKNEEICKKAVKGLQESLKKSEEKYQLLKKHAEDKLAEANAEVTRLQTTNKNEVTVLQATLKRERAKITSLEQSLNQKINENKEVTAICDELIAKVGPLQ